LREIVADIREAGGDADYILADLSEATVCDHVYSQICDRWGHADIWVNNAGFAWYGFGEHIPWSLAERMIAVNTIAVARLTQLALGDMKARDRGHVINVGSIAGVIPSQGVAHYSATKAFVDAFSTSLHRETRGTGVNVSVVRAGAVATPFYERVLQHSEGRRIPVERFAVSAEKVAERIWALIQKPARLAYVPAGLWIVPWIELCFGWLMDRLGPRLLAAQSRD
jgi:short-subunit dehydrogenase